MSSCLSPANNLKCARNLTVSIQPPITASNDLWNPGSHISPPPPFNVTMEPDRPATEASFEHEHGHSKDTSEEVAQHLHANWRRSLHPLRTFSLHHLQAPKQQSM
ncbi:hypothetical protein E4U17_000357 [Claviceps sp. LM77 group G4]|nr:hypothetical protein E4U17_000357 [Claviceps sp. LM77 group G4]